MPSEWIIAGIALGTVLIWIGIIVGLFYAHVAECSRFRVDMISRLERIEAHQLESVHKAYE